jgi:hypothetical protein
MFYKSLDFQLFSCTLRQQLLENSSQFALIILFWIQFQLLFNKAIRPSKSSERHFRECLWQTIDLSYLFQFETACELPMLAFSTKIQYRLTSCCRYLSEQEPPNTSKPKCSIINRSVGCMFHCGWTRKGFLSPPFWSHRTYFPAFIPGVSTYSGKFPAHWVWLVRKHVC